jgi:plastocyanin
MLLHLLPHQVLQSQLLQVLQLPEIRLTPDTLTVTKGDVITVTNDDTVPHTATSGSGPEDPNSAKLFDTSIIMAGETGQIDTASLEPADYAYFCTVHPFMKGTITVQ